MKLTLGDKEYTSTLMGLYELSIGEARTIKRNTGMTITEWQLGLALFSRREDADILAGLVFLLRSRAGEQVAWSDIDTLPIKSVKEGFDVTDLDDAELREHLSAATPPAESDSADQLGQQDRAESGEDDQPGSADGQVTENDNQH